MERKTLIWIEAGYSTVAQAGFTGLTVESISREVGKNKSSFYHHFGDLEVFKGKLLSHHIGRAKLFATELENCHSIRPGMIHVFLHYKRDFLFHKQLRIQRGNPEYRKCFESVHSLFETAIGDTWAAYLRLEDKKHLSKTFLRLVSENFLLQITEENYTFEWLDNYLAEVSILLTQLKPGAAD